MSFRNKTIPTILIIIIIAISMFSYFQSKKRAEIDRVPDSISINDTVNVPNIDTSHILLRIEDKTNYFFLKDLNYPLMNFFKNINKKNYEEIELRQEYVDFYNLSDKYLSNKYGDYANLFYDIVSINKSNDVYFVNVNYREDNSDKTYYKAFSIKDGQLADEPLKKIEDVDYFVDRSKFKASIASKAVFDGYEVYKVVLDNKTTDYLKIGSDMYGFYAIDGNNKYYHKLESENKIGYDIMPGETRVFYVRFDVVGPTDIYINVEGSDYIFEKTL